MNRIDAKSKLYDVAKCFTALLVVIAHTTRMYTPLGAIPVSSQSPFLNNLTNYIYSFHMPLFIMLSGCVYGYCIEKHKYTNVFSFVQKKGKKLLIPYFAFGVLWVAPIMCILGLADNGYVDYVIHGIVLSNNSRHLWYILALFWIFLLYIVFRPFLLKGIYELIVVGFCSLLLFFASRIAPSTFQISAALNYQFYFFLGILFNRFYSTILHFFRTYYIVGFCLPFVLMLMFIINPNFITDYIYKGIGITMVMFLCWYLLQCFPNFTNHSLYRIIKQNSFGIYLFHPMIIYVLFHWLGQYSTNPILLSTFISIAATVLSIYASKFMRILHLQFLIGE